MFQTRNRYRKYIIENCSIFFDVEYEEDNPSSGEAPGSRLKVVGRLADQCQDALVQLGTFLASSHAPDEYAARLPPLQVACFTSPLSSVTERSSKYKKVLF